MKSLLLSLFLLFSTSAFAQEPTVKIYIAPQIGDGTFQNPFRSKLNNYINVHAGESFDEIDNPARRYSICFVIAQPATHATIATDPEIVALTPNDINPPQLATELDREVSSLPTAFRTTVQNALEARGISFAWIGQGNTIRDVFRYLLRIHFLAQRFEGEANANALEFLRQNLNTNVSALPAGVRNAVRTWMESKGLDTSGYIGMTVRQALHAIVNDLGFGQIKIGGQGF